MKSIIKGFDSILFDALTFNDCLQKMRIHFFRWMSISPKFASVLFVQFLSTQFGRFNTLRTQQNGCRFADGSLNAFP